MSGAAPPGGKARRRDRWLKHFRSSSPATSSSINAQTSSSNSTSLQLVSATPCHQSSLTSATQLSVPITHSSTVPSPSAFQQLTLGPSRSRDFLDAALRLLSDGNRKTLQPYILSANGEINKALESSLTAAKQMQGEWAAKRWTFTFAGRTVTLKEEADKIVRWLDRFKAVGDVAVSADPIHAGLPWAFVRLLLQVRSCLLCSALAI